MLGLRADLRVAVMTPIPGVPSEPSLVAESDLDADVETTANQAVIDIATGILMDRRGCTADEADALLSDAAQEHDMNVSDLARCLVADQELR